MSPAAADAVVRYETIDDHVALVTLDRPRKRNAINAAMAAQLDACVRRAEADPQVRAVILASSDPAAFCAGADLAEVAANGGQSLYTADGGFAGFVSARRRKPWIAAARGAVLAGGMELCLACEMIVAAEDSRFGVPEVNRSLIAAEGGVTRLMKAVPRAIALELIATGEPIDAQRAYEIGLVNRVVAADHVLAAALALGRAIAANAPVAVEESLAVAKAASVLSDEAGRELAQLGLERLRQSDDYREGPRAFLEKRPPVWKGR